jgi:hypothetical protein
VHEALRDRMLISTTILNDIELNLVEFNNGEILRRRRPRPLHLVLQLPLPELLQIFLIIIFFETRKHLSLPKLIITAARIVSIHVKRRQI